MTVKVLPCPKCGHPTSKVEEYDGDHWRICQHCRMATAPAMSAAAATRDWNDRTKSPKASGDVTGLIRGKPLVFSVYGKGWHATSEFGGYYIYKEREGNRFHWTLEISGESYTTISEGYGDTLELAQSACQADHDARAMASVEVVPFEWAESGDSVVKAGAFTLRVHSQGAGDAEWIWSIAFQFTVLEFGIVESREKAIQFAEQFVRQLVMGVQ